MITTFKKYRRLLRVTACAFLTLLSSTPAYAEQLPVDLIVYGDYLVTMDPAVVENSGVIRDGAVVITAKDILAVGPRDEIDNQYRGRKTISGKDRILMPGLINGHNHSAMVLFRGMADDLKLMEWLNDFIFPMEARFVNPGFIEVGTRLACWEMIRGGTTTFVDMYFYPDVIARVVEECGLRAVISSPSIDFPSPGYKGWDDSFQGAVDFIKRWKNVNERITPAFAPHAPYTVSPGHIRQVAQMAKQLDVPVSMHIAEAPSEVTDIRTRYGNTPVNHVAEQGLLGVRLIAAHMVQPNLEEIAMLAKEKVGVIHNPTSNLKLAAGVAPVAKMIEAGVLVGLGTDGAASNNDLDMWEEIHLTALIHKNQNQDPTVMPSMTALKMATSMGAAAIGLDKVTGVLKAGLRADMIQVDISSPRLTPMYNVVSQLVYAVDSSDVVTTIVSGRILMEEAQVLTLNAEVVRAAAIVKTRQIAEALLPAPSVN